MWKSHFSTTTTKTTKTPNATTYWTITISITSDSSVKSFRNTLFHTHTDILVAASLPCVASIISMRRKNKRHALQSIEWCREWIIKLEILNWNFIDILSIEVGVLLIFPNWHLNKNQFISVQCVYEVVLESSFFAVIVVKQSNKCTKKIIIKNSIVPQCLRLCVDRFFVRIEKKREKNLDNYLIYVKMCSIFHCFIPLFEWAKAQRIFRKVSRYSNNLTLCIE